MKDTGKPFPEALAVTRAGNLFTTHTAVEAGFDRFSVELHLPRCLDARALGLETGCYQQLDDIKIELRIVAEDSAPIRITLRGRFLATSARPIPTSDVRLL
jgi:hypothetical protein